MGMETRGNNRYYYRKERRGTRVISSYVGTGATAELIAQCEFWRRAEERQERAKLKGEQEASKQQALLVLGTEAGVRDLVKAVFIACGFHQHKRQWRKSSMQQDISTIEQPTTHVAPRSDDGWPALKAAIDMQPTPTGKGGKVTKADEEAAEKQRVLAVRQVLRDYPGLWSRARRVISNAERELVERVTPNEGLPREFLETSLRGIRRDLGYETAPMLEKLLIEQIAVAWLDWDIVQQMYANNAVGSHKLSSGIYWDRRVTGAQARYLRAMEALARVRRLAMPQPLQVNIGGQQVNVAGG